MARGRMIDKRIGRSRKLAVATEPARQMWFMVLPNLDREGRIEFADLDDLSIEVIPLFHWPLEKIAAALNNLADVGLLTMYPNESKLAIAFTRFEDFQLGMRKDREAPSAVPRPPAVTPDNSGVFRIGPALRLNKVKGRKEGRNKENSLVLRKKWESELYKKYAERISAAREAGDVSLYEQYQREIQDEISARLRERQGG